MTSLHSVLARRVLGGALAVSLCVLGIPAAASTHEPSGAGILDPDGNPVVIDHDLRAESELTSTHVGMLRSASAVAAAKAPRAKKKLKTLVIPVFWKGAGKDSSTKRIKKRVKKALGTADTYYRTVSRGRIGHATTTLGWQKIARPAQRCGISSQANHIASKASAKARSAGKNPARFDRVIFYVTGKACAKSTPTVLGLGSMPGKYVWLEGSLAPNVVIHELGHNLGLEHSNYYRCGNDAKRSVLHAKPAKCSVTEYGDVADVMGNMPYARWFSGPKLAHLGWLTKKQLVRNTSTKKKTYSLSPISPSSKTAKAVRARASSTRTYWIEYRRTVGLDKGLPSTATGVQIRMTDSRGRLTPRNASLVLDMHPFAPTADFRVYDPEAMSLGAGSTWVSPEGIRFSVGKTGAKAKVTVTRKASKAKKPATPTSLTVTPGYGSLSVAWKRSKDKGMPITHYEVRTTSSAGTQTRRVVSVGGTKRSVQLASSDHTQDHAVQVRAVSPRGASGWSSTVSARSLDPAPVVTISSPAEGSTVAGPSYRVTVTATARPGHPLEELRVCGYESASIEPVCKSATPSSGSQHSFDFTFSGSSGTWDLQVAAMAITTTRYFNPWVVRKFKLSVP